MSLWASDMALYRAFGGWAKPEASGPELSLQLLFFCAQEPLTDAEKMK